MMEAVELCSPAAATCAVHAQSILAIQSPLVLILSHERSRLIGMIQFSSTVSPTLFIQFTLEAGYRFISLTARVIRQESRSRLIGDANLLVCRNLQLSVFRYRHWRRARRAVPDYFSFFHHERHALSRGDIRGRIARHRDNICELSFLECASLLSDSEKFRCRRSR